MEVTEAMKKKYPNITGITPEQVHAEQEELRLIDQMRFQAALAIYTSMTKHLFELKDSGANMDKIIGGRDVVRFATQYSIEQADLLLKGLSCDLTDEVQAYHIDVIKGMGALSPNHF